MERNGQGALSALEILAVEELKGAEDQLAHLHEALWVSPIEAEAETARLSKLTGDAEEDAEICRKQMARAIEGAANDDWGKFARRSFLPRAESLPGMKIKMPPGFRSNAPPLSAATSLRIGKEGDKGHRRTIPRKIGNSFREKGSVRSRVYPSSIKAIHQRFKETIDAVVRLVNGAAPPIPPTEQESEAASIMRGAGQECPTGGNLDTDKANEAPLLRIPSRASSEGDNDRFFPFRNSTAGPLLKAGLYGNRDHAADADTPSATHCHMGGLDKLRIPVFDDMASKGVACGEGQAEGEVKGARCDARSPSCDSAHSDINHELRFVGSFPHHRLIQDGQGTKRCRSLPRDMGSQRMAYLLISPVVSEGNPTNAARMIGGIAGAQVSSFAAFAQYVGFQFRGSLSGYESGNSSCSPEEFNAAFRSTAAGTGAAGHGRGAERFSVPAEPGRRNRARSRPGRNREVKPLKNVEHLGVSCPRTQKQITREACPGRKCT